MDSFIFPLYLCWFFLNDLGTPLILARSTFGLYYFKYLMYRTIKVFQSIGVSFLLILCLIQMQSCSGTVGKQKINEPIVSNLKSAEQQLDRLLTHALAANKNPRTIDGKGGIHWATLDADANALGGFDWTLGFFPGSCWYMFEYTGDNKWKKAAEKFQAMHKKFSTLKGSHDLGFVFNSSYGNGYRITKNEAYKQLLIDAGDALIGRFNENVGCIQSWDVDRGWQSKRGWQFPVIIDNMMNLELLFELSLLTGDDKYREVAISHANNTMKNHFREDNSSYHVIDYDSLNGKVRNRNTAQGYSHESAWARGQAWGAYGYTVCYRYTKNPIYLEQARKIADFIINFKRMPNDVVPYWDYNAPNIPDEPRDVSAAAITASALLELNTYTDQAYLQYADKILSSLSSEEYLAKPGEINDFLLKHSVGSIPHGFEIDVPINYADYYYIEALIRKNKSQNEVY